MPDPSGGGRDGTEVKQEDFFRVYNSVLGGDIIPTDIKNLDSDHVYAIITLPGRVVPTIDSRHALLTPEILSCLYVLINLWISQPQAKRIKQREILKNK